MGMPEMLSAHRIAMPFPEHMCAFEAPSSWPLPDDFPIVVDIYGNVVSKYGDPAWDFSVLAGRPARLTFGSAKGARGPLLSEENASLFRQVAAWWLFGPAGVKNALTLCGMGSQLRPIFAICSEHGISASDISKYPHVIESISKKVSDHNVNRLLYRLHDLWLNRSDLGFTLLDKNGIALLSKSLTQKKRNVQTAYIPPRIWTYQVLRLRQCLDEFLSHREKVEDCYRFCFDAYVRNAGGHEKAFQKMQQKIKPFEPTIPSGPACGGRIFYGPFELTAEKFGVRELFERWVGPECTRGVKGLQKYLSLVSDAGLAFVINFSLMRISEACGLREGCYDVDVDSLGDGIHTLGEVHSVTGATSKTLRDDDARWIVSPSCQIAIDAMTSVSRLRSLTDRWNPHIQKNHKDHGSPLLFRRISEPWGSKETMVNVAVKPRSYSEIIRDYPLLFDEKELAITGEDMKIASQMTPDLDPNFFSKGKPWQFRWHQLRRTGACNMLFSGLVSEASLQYQLKHLSRAMTRYYGQNYFKLGMTLDEDAREYFIREMYEALARQFQALNRDGYISPYGEKRKAQILAPISVKDHQQLVHSAKAGKLSYRETFFGGCAKPGEACPLGGISNITGCMGFGKESPCEWVLLKRERRAAIEKLNESFKVRLKKADPNSPLADSLRASIESTDRAIHVIDNQRCS